MASWKKVVVSGSNAQLAALQVDNLTSGQVVLGGGATGNLSTSAINGTGNILATTGASGVQMSGSFSGSFAGDGSNLTGVVSASYAPVFPYNGRVQITGSVQVFGSSSAILIDGTAPSPFTNTALQVAGKQQTGSVLLVDTFNSSSISGSMFVGRRARGTATSQSALLVNDDLATFGGIGYVSGSTTYSNLNTYMMLQAAETWTTASQGSFITFSTTALGTTSSAENVKIFNSGLVVTGSVIATSLTGSHFGTSSYATQAFSSSYATSASYALSSSYALSTTSASFATSALTASFLSGGAPTANALTNGKGVQLFSFNGSVAVTASVSGSDTLTSNTIPKWTGTAFNNSSVTDDGTTFAINSNKFTVVESSGNTTVAGTLSVSQDATFGGNLTVNGTTTFINTTNTFIKDQFIMMTSGSNTLKDGGIIFQYTTGSGGPATTAPSGSAIFLSSTSTGTVGRFAVAFDVQESVTSVTANSFVVTVNTAAGVPSSAPTWGGSSSGYGNMYINSSNSDIFIYA